MIKELLITILLILALPIGYLLAYLTRDELVKGRKYFKLIILMSSVLAVIFLFFNSIVSLGLIFMSLVTLISLAKSYDKRFVK